jgi:hypothetical protein
MRYQIVSRARLGDLLLCLPGAMYLSRKGHEVYLEAPPQWGDMLRLVSYVKPYTESIKPKIDRVLNTKIIELRRSRSRIIDYISEWFPDLYGMKKQQTVTFDRTVDVPDYGLPERYALVSPFGYSQSWRPKVDWFADQVRQRWGDSLPMFVLSDRKYPEMKYQTVVAKSVSHLPAIISNATEFMTVNSSPSIIAGGARQKLYYHVFDHDNDGRSNYDAPNQVVVDAR